MAELEPDICEKLKRLGYARSNYVRLYGEQFQLVSDPFPHGTGIAIEAVKSGEQERRIVKLPLPVLKVAMAKAA